jgi:hypothetical protein
MTRLRAELRIWFRRFKAREFFEMTATSLISRDPSHSQTWRLDMVAWNENRPEALAGLHSKDGRLLVLFDEASAIPATIWDTCEAICTDALQAIWLCTGNPLHPVGRFSRLFRALRPSLDHQARRFPRELNVSRTDPLVIGVDVARFGDDCSVIYPRRGMDARSILPMTFRGIPLDKLEDHVVAFCNAHRVAQISSMAPDWAAGWSIISGGAVIRFLMFSLAPARISSSTARASLISAPSILRNPRFIDSRKRDFREGYSTRRRSACIMIGLATLASIADALASRQSARMVTIPSGRAPTRSESRRSPRARAGLRSTSTPPHPPKRRCAPGIQIATDWAGTCSRD